jgi:hypothetical protein
MSFKVVRTLAVAAAMYLAASTAVAGPSWTGGMVFDHTSVPGGLLIRFDASVPMPDNCGGPASSWMIIPETKKTILAVTMMAIAMGNRYMDVYTSGPGLGGYCEINQVDPAK